MDEVQENLNDTENSISFSDFDHYKQNLTDEQKQMIAYMKSFHEKTGYTPVPFEDSTNKFQVDGLNARQIQRLVESHLSKEIFGLGRSDFKQYVEIDLRPLDGLGMLYRYCFDVNDNIVNYYD